MLEMTIVQMYVIFTLINEQSFFSVRMRIEICTQVSHLYKDEKYQLGDNASGLNP